jgi:preprotein translocase subunit YajC
MDLMLSAVILQAGEKSPGSPLGPFIPIVAIFAIFYFLLIRPQKQQQKAHAEMVSQLSKGDEVETIGGIVGKIVHLTDDRVTIRSAGDTRLEIDRSKVGRKLAPGGTES